MPQTTLPTHIQVRGAHVNNLKNIDISGWDLSKATGGWTTRQVFASFTNASKTVINLNNVKLPSDFNLATSFANGQVVITNNGDLLQ